MPTTGTAPTTSALLPSETVVARIRRHIEAGTTDIADGTWSEPVENYRSEARFRAEQAVLRSTAVPVLPERGAGQARRLHRQRQSGRADPCRTGD